MWSSTTEQPSLPRRATLPGGAITEGHVRISLPQLVAIGVGLGFSIGLTAQTPAPGGQAAKPSATTASSRPAIHTQAAGEANNPVADPKAVVSIGNARFTVLTPELIRMEWAAD